VTSGTLLAVLATTSLILHLLHDPVVMTGEWHMED